MFDQNLLRRVGIAKPERGVKLNYRLIPGELFFVGEYRKQQSGLPLGIRSCHEQRVLIYRIGLAQLADSEPTLVYDPAAIDQRDRGAGDTELLHCGLRE